MLIRGLVCGGMALARLVELAYSRRNLARLGPAEEGVASQRSFPLIIGVHTAVIGGTFLLGKKPCRVWLMCLALLQVLRAWVVLSMGQSWSARGAVSEQTHLVTRGPYRYLRHPNYAVVIAELAVLPLAFGTKRVAVAGTFVNTALLAVRIRDEERLLFRLPGYREHFGPKRRLIPGLL